MLYLYFNLGVSKFMFTRIQTYENIVKFLPMGAHAKLFFLSCVVYGTFNGLDRIIGQ